MMLPVDSEMDIQIKIDIIYESIRRCCSSIEVFKDGDRDLVSALISTLEREEAFLDAIKLTHPEFFL